MVFISNYLHSSNLEFAASRLKRYSKWKVLNYKFGAAEIELDEYFKKNYHINLQLLCLKILKNTKVLTNKMDTIFSIISDKKYDTLARLITYGNESVPGSNILKAALTI